MGRTQPEQAFLGWPSLWLSGWLKMWKVHKLICCQLRKRRRRRNGGKTEEVGRRVTAGFVGGSERKKKKERAMEGGKRSSHYAKGRDSKVVRICERVSERARGVGKKGRNNFYLSEGRTRTEIKETERQTEKNYLKISKMGNIRWKRRETRTERT